MTGKEEKTQTGSGPAARVTDHIRRHDRLIEIFGMDIEHTAPGEARVSMQVGPDHLNAAGFCHGAAMFALADVAFALAANCHGQMALALECSINYFRPAKPGAVLTATVEEVFRGRRTGNYIARIEDNEGRLVCLFKSTSFQIDDDRSVIETGGQDK